MAAMLQFVPNNYSASSGYPILDMSRGLMIHEVPNKQQIVGTLWLLAALSKSPDWLNDVYVCISYIYVYVACLGVCLSVVVFPALPPSVPEY